MNSWGTFKKNPRRFPWKNFRRNPERNSGKQNFWRFSENRERTSDWISEYFLWESLEKNPKKYVEDFLKKILHELYKESLKIIVKNFMETLLKRCMHDYLEKNIVQTLEKSHMKLHKAANRRFYKRKPWKIPEWISERCEGILAGFPMEYF